MRKSALLAALVLAVALPATADAATCLQFTRIGSTQAIDAKTILFHMKDGTVWRNTMRSVCPGAMSGGFSYVLQTDSVCENTQTIRILNSNETCLLGGFTKEPPAHRG